MIKWLKGKKTHISALAIAVTTVAHSLSWIDNNTYLTLVGLLGAGGLSALRNGVNKSK